MTQTKHLTPAQSSILERILCVASQFWLPKNRFLHSHNKSGLHCIRWHSYPSQSQHFVNVKATRHLANNCCENVCHRFTKCPNHISLSAPGKQLQASLKGKKIWLEDRVFWLKRCRKELCNDDLLTMSLERIILQQIFLRCFCLGCVPNHNVLNMGLIYYTQLLHSKKTVTTKISWKPNTDHLYFLYRVVHQRCWTDKYKNEFLPNWNFPLHHHIKQTSLRSLKSISRKNTWAASAKNPVMPWSTSQ